MTDSSAKLEPFILLARSTKGAAAAKVVMDATAAPGVYVFADLLDLPNIRELESSTEHAKQFHLLELFAYGTWKDYNAASGHFLQLSPAHITKLKHLTLISLALSSRSLRYDDLLPALDIQSIQELEDLIIDVIYTGLLKGKMHHHEQTLHVDWVSGRDIRLTDLAGIQAGLENWCSTASTLLAALDEQIKSVQSASQAEKAQEEAYNAHRDALVNQYASSRSNTTNPRFPRQPDPFEPPKRAEGGEILDQLLQFQREPIPAVVGENSGRVPADRVGNDEAEGSRGVKRSRE